MTNSRRTTVLYALNWLGHRDEDIFRMTEEIILKKEGPITEEVTDDLSHSFFVLSKFKFTS